MTDRLYIEAVEHIVALGFDRGDAESIAEMELDDFEERQAHYKFILGCNAADIEGWIGIRPHRCSAKRTPINELKHTISRLEASLDEIRKQRSELVDVAERHVEEGAREIIRSEWMRVQMYCERLARVAGEEANR